jgi:hypothetical protein
VATLADVMVMEVPPIRALPFRVITKLGPAPFAERSGLRARVSRLGERRETRPGRHA